MNEDHKHDVNGVLEIVDRGDVRAHTKETSGDCEAECYNVANIVWAIFTDWKEDNR